MKTEKTPPMMTAAPVTTPAPAAMPPTIASREPSRPPGGEQDDDGERQRGGLGALHVAPDAVVDRRREAGVAGGDGLDGSGAFRLDSAQHELPT
ncbi:hypothetical protein ACFTTN_05995 [Streptomyces niveus]|uniref:hypothetical protein n=1 Tax=Streptomyces niveus TaxID=193462 RepID=UPI0036420228